MEDAEAALEQLQLHDGSSPEARPCRILTLGDGNFSFSLALARALLLPPPPPIPTPPREGEPPQQQQHPRLPPKSFEIVATSFDGPLDLLTKYPESPGIISALRAMGVTVLHNVDATALDSRVAAAAPAPDGCAHPRFDHVIFNHPHTGTEDMRRHRSFLGHFFHEMAACSATTPGDSADDAPVNASRGNSGGSGSGSSVQDRGGVVVDGSAVKGPILSPEGAVHVTLALEQPERWGLEEQASRHGFSLAHRRRFPGEQIDGYMTKRHQTGRSFRQRVQDSETLSFTWAEYETRDDGGVAFGGDRGRTLPPWLWPEVRMCDDRVALATGNGHAAGAPKLSADVARHGNAKGNDGSSSRDESDGRQFVAVRAGAAAAAVVPPSLPEVCELCGKRYKTPQGLRTHTRQFHELGQEGGVPLAPKTERPCPNRDCGRVFTSERALDQHVSAKHRGENVDIKPDWFVGSIYHLEQPRSDGSRHASTAVEDNPDRQSGGGIGVGGENHRRAAGPTETDSRNPEEDRGARELLDSSSGPSVLCRRDSGEFEQCDVCGFWFSCPGEAQQHLDNLRPPIEGKVAYFDCDTCGKNFGSRRALLQHANFCGGIGGDDREVVA